MRLSGAGIQLISAINQYHTHIFVFFVALLIGLTLAHPAVLLNDEFITTNQLRQLHAGHQIIINEGKYGLLENGSMSGYFAYKSNLLGYTLFHPLISLPAFWMIDLTGENCVYLILCLWTLSMLIIVLMINHFYSDLSYFRNFRWTPIALIATFVIFYVNLFFYMTFPVDSVENYPEVIAIVITNMFLLSISTVIMYEINRTIFEDPAYSFFGTIVCLFSSSYLLWATHCKDHILVLPVFAGIFLCMIRLIKTDDFWYLPLVFILTGLLAWIRPELALWIFLTAGMICLYFLAKSRAYKRAIKDLLLIFCSPFFTLIGALPFFLNNYLITKNFLLPVQSIYLSEKPSFVIVNSSSQLVPATGITSVESVIMMFIPKTLPTPQIFLSDLTGIIFYPENGSISITALIPLFLIMTILAVALLLSKKISVSPEERKYIGISFLVSLSIFLAYVSVIHTLNTDPGIIPDMRYLSPLYLPLTITGLIFLKKMDIIPERSADLLMDFFIVCVVGLVISIVTLPIVYGPGAFSATVNIPLGKFFSIYILALSLITVGAILIYKYLNQGKQICAYLVFLLCTIPFFWQVNAIIVYRSFSAFSGYTFWIPIIRKIWELIVNFIMLKTVLP